MHAVNFLITTLAENGHIGRFLWGNVLERIVIL